MPTILDGKTYTVTIEFTGLVGQLDYDSSNMDLILHDGATPGGVRFLNESNSDSKYQTKSDDLDGLTAFEPQQRGFLVRRAPGDYRIRELKVNTNNLTLEESKGYEGDPTFSLAETVTSAHTWQGTQTFEGKLVASGGVEGDVTGNLNGDVLGDTAGKHTGEVDTSASTLTLGDEQVELEWLSKFVQQSLVPPGCIIMWSGASNAIPTGWYLCNGNNGTPDLRGRFIVGAAGAYAVGNNGGSATANPEITLEQGGAHSHEASGGTIDSATTGITLTKTTARPENEQHQVTVLSDVAVNDPGHTHTLDGLTIEQGGAHSHEGQVDEFSILPPYYALCYIMKAATAL